MTSLIATGHSHIAHRSNDLEGALLFGASALGPYELPAEDWSSRRNIVLLDPDAVRIQRVLDDVLRLVVATLSRSFEDLPDVFVLKPISTQRVTLSVRDRGYAPFRFVPED
jgi:hypothetical protein